MTALTFGAQRRGIIALVIGWHIVATLCAGLTALGAGVDQLLLESQRTRLYDWALAQWLRLSELRVSDLPGRLAGRLLRAWSFMARTRARAWLLPVALSCALTAGAALVGRALRFAVVADHIDPGELERELPRHVRWYVGQLGDGHYVPALVTNCLFDLVTLFVFAAMLHAIQRRQTALGRGALLLAGGLAAIALAFANLAVAHVATVAVWGPYHDSDIGAASAALWHFLSLRIRLAEARYFDDIAYASTTMLPMLLFIVVLFVLVLAKGLLAIVLRGIVHWLRLIADTHPRDVRDKLRPFLLLGTLAGLLGALAKAVFDVSTALAK